MSAPDPFDEPGFADRVQDRFFQVCDAEPPDDWVYCANGHACDWEDCDNCGGEGSHDMYEVDPLWYDPGDTEACDRCEGKGGWWLCNQRCGAEAVLDDNQGENS
jgi:hypothetical protein